MWRVCVYTIFNHVIRCIFVDILWTCKGGERKPARVFSVKPARKMISLWKSSKQLHPDAFQTTFSLNTVYNRHLLHQTPCRPDTFYTRHIFTRHLLHPTPLTPNTFYTKHLLYQTPFKPGTFYTRHLLHPTPFTPDNFFTKHILQQAHFTPNTLYTRHLLYQAHLHQTPFTPCVNHPPPPHPLLILTSFARWNYA